MLDEGGVVAVVVEDDFVSPDGVLVVVEVVDEDDGGSDFGGGTTTVVDGEVGGALDDGALEGVCCWQAESANSVLTAMAVRVSRIIGAPS